MCDHDTADSPPTQPRFGSRLEHGQAHAEDHARWSRRDFLTGLGLVTAGGAIMLGGTPVRAFGQTSLLQHLRALETDRTLVLIQLTGGNDGLNTVTPRTNDIYYRLRPHIAIRDNQGIPINDTLSLHPALQPLKATYGDGRMAVIQNVGRPNYSLSHFIETDAWLSAPIEGDLVASGWVGRSLNTEFPDFIDHPPAYPLAVQLGGVSSLLVAGPESNMGMSLASPDEFVRLAEQGVLYDPDDVPATPYGAEMSFLRTMAKDSVIYAEAIQGAAETGLNQVEYPPSDLARNLSITARLIKGRLGARVYHVSIGGFDTHASQGSVFGTHANLLRTLAEAVQAFLADLDAADGFDDVLVMTFSEFGRRVEQNGSHGTDHGTAAPMFLFGGVTGGVYGTDPNLSDLDADGNLKFEIDFRSVYATALQDWFGFDAAATAGILGGAYETLGFVGESAPISTATESAGVPERFVLEQNYPNPFNPRTTITYALPRTERVTIRVFDVQGRAVATLVDAPKAAGRHTVAFDASGLPSGFYLYRLQAGSFTETKTMALVK